MDIGAEVLRVGTELAELARNAGTPLSALSPDLGRHPNYLSRAVAGRLELKVRDLFAALLELRANPREFITWLFPFGGALERELDPEGAGLPPPKDSLAETLRRLEKKRGHHLRTADDLTELVRAQMADTLRRKKIKQAQACRRLGVGPKVLSNLLHGRTQLTLAQLFTLMAVTQITPGRFFHELFYRPDGEPFDQLRWVRGLDQVEARYLRMAGLRADELGFKLPAAASEAPKT